MLAINETRLLERIHALGAVGIDADGRRTRLAASDEDTACLLYTSSSQQILSQLLQTDGLTVISSEHKVSPEILPLYDTILELKDKRLVERA